MCIKAPREQGFKNAENTDKRLDPGMQRSSSSPDSLDGDPLHATSGGKKPLPLEVIHDNAVSADLKSTDSTATGTAAEVDIFPANLEASGEVETRRAHVLVVVVEVVAAGIAIVCCDSGEEAASNPLQQC